MKQTIERHFPVFDGTLLSMLSCFHTFSSTQKVLDSIPFSHTARSNARPRLQRLRCTLASSRNRCAQLRQVQPSPGFSTMCSEGATRNLEVPKNYGNFKKKHKRHVKPPIHQVVKPSYFQSICNIRVLGPHDLAIGFALKCDTCSCNKHQAAGSDFRSLSTSKRDI